MKNIDYMLVLNTKYAPGCKVLCNRTFLKSLWTIRGDAKFGLFWCSILSWNLFNLLLMSSHLLCKATILGGLCKYIASIFFSIFQSVCSSISIRQKCAIASGKIRATQAPCHHMNKWRSSVTHVCIQFNRLPHRRPLVTLSLLLALASWLTKSRASGNLRPIDSHFLCNV